MGEPQSSAGSAAPLQKLNIGSIFSRSFSVIRRNIGPLAVVTLLSFLFQIVVSELSGTYALGTEAETAPAWILPLIWLPSLAFSAFLFGVVTFGTVQDLRGRQAGLGEWLRHGLQALLPVALLSIVYYVVVAVGTILLIVPGIIFMLMLWVVFPVVVMERPGVLASLRRSAFLTKGNRWRLLGLTLLMVLSMGAVLGVLMFIMSSAMSVAPLSIGFSAVYAVFGIVWMISLSVTYYELRIAKEGVDIGRVAAVFD
jgi:hypothetical protein